jgi:hypothetical protein
MRRGVRWITVLGLTTAAAVGCKHAPVPRVFYPPEMPAPATTVEVPSAPLSPLEPKLETLPLLDPATADVTGATRPPAIGLTEEVCAKLAYQHAPIASAVERENSIPVVADPDRPPPEESLQRDLRPLVVAEMRNRAAGEAVVAFYQLADLEGRSAVVRETIEEIDVLRKAVEDAIKRGAKPPIDLEEIARQRATWIGLLGQAELGAKLLDADLKRRIGASGKTADRVMPTGEFGLPMQTLDIDAAVRVGLEKRPELQALRSAYLNLSPETLPEVREFLRAMPSGGGVLGSGAMGGMLGGVGPRLPVFKRIAERKQAEATAALQAAADQEVAVRRAQLFTLIDERERAVADEVRAQALVLGEQARQVGLTRWRVEKLKAKVELLRKEEKGAASVVPAELELNRERADLIQAVMQWHQARAKLSQAQGLYVK